MSSFHKYDFDSDDEDEWYDEDRETTAFETIKPSFVLFIIDIHQSMFTINESIENHLTPFQMALQAIYSVADKILLSSNTRSYNLFAVAVALKTSNEDITFLIDFQSNFLDGLKKLKEVASMDGEKIIDTYSKGPRCDFLTILQNAKKALNAIKTPAYKKSVIFITNDDKPVNDQNEKFTVTNEIQNYQACDIDFELISTRSEFKEELFYNELLWILSGQSKKATSAPKLSICTDSIGLKDKINNCLETKFFARQQIKMYISEQNYLKLIRRKCMRKSGRHLLNNVRLTEDGKTVSRQKVVRESSDPKAHICIKKSLEKIKLSREDYKKFQKPCKFLQGYTLVHTAPRQMERHMTFGRGTLIYLDPNEADNETFVAIFNAIWQYCIDHNNVLVCVRKLRKSDRIKLSEFIPKQINNIKIFLEKKLPHYRNIRLSKINFLKPVEGKKRKYGGYPTNEDEDQVKAVTKLVNALTFDYKPEMFPLYTVQVKEAYAKAKLLEDEEVNLHDLTDRIKDNTLNVEKTDERVGKIASEIKGLFPERMPEKPKYKRKKK